MFCMNHSVDYIIDKMWMNLKICKEYCMPTTVLQKMGRAGWGGVNSSDGLETSKFQSELEPVFLNSFLF